MTKLRFYHRWTYRLYFYFWTPIFAENPEIMRFTADWMNDYLKRHGKDRSEG